MADNLCYTAEKSLRDAGDKVAADVKKDIEDKVKALREILNTASVADLKAKTQELSLAVQKIGEALYKQGDPSTGSGPVGPQGGPQTPPAGGQNGPQGTGEVKEGEVVS